MTGSADDPVAVAVAHCRWAQQDRQPPWMVIAAFKPSWFTVSDNSWDEAVWAVAAAYYELNRSHEHKPQELRRAA